MEPGLARTWAADLAHARREATVIKPPSDGVGSFMLEDGYALGARLARWAHDGGWRIAGRKIGMTDRSKWAGLGIERVMWAPIYHQTVQFVAVDGGDRVPLSGLVSPRVETEVVFRLRKTPPADATEPIDLLEAIEWMATGIEVVDCHLPGWMFQPADALADFFFHAALIVGVPRPVRTGEDLGRDLSESRATLQVVRGTERKTVTGRGSNVLGSPLASLLALVRLLDERGEEPLQPNEIVTTGTYTSPEPVSIGDELLVDIERLALSPLHVRLVDEALTLFPS